MARYNTSGNAFGDEIDLSEQADLAQSTVVGRAAGAGTGVPTALTGTQVKAIIGAIGTSDLAADAVNGDKIADDAVDSEHLATDAVDANALDDTAVSGVARTFTTMQGVAETTLADGATSWDMSATSNNIYILLEENTTLGFPTNLRAGSGIIKIAQDGTGSHTFGWNASYKFAGGTAPTVTSTASAIDYFSYICDGTDVVIFTVGQAVATA